MRVRECFAYLARDVDGNPLEDRDGNPLMVEGERWIEVEGVVSEAEGIAQALDQAKEAERQAIRDELAANDAKVVRALLDGDTARIEAHKATQAALRAKLA